MNQQEINKGLIECAKLEARNIFDNHPDPAERREVMQRMRDYVVKPLERMQREDPAGITDDMIRSAKISDLVEAHVKDTLEPAAKGLKADIHADARLKSLANGRLCTSYMGSTQPDTSEPSMAGRFQMARQDAHSPAPRQPQAENGFKPTTIRFS